MTRLFEFRRVNKLTDGTVCSVDPAAGAAVLAY
jgi:hypothetical protein